MIAVTAWAVSAAGHTACKADDQINADFLGGANGAESGLGWKRRLFGGVAKQHCHSRDAFEHSHHLRKQCPLSGLRFAISSPIGARHLITERNSPTRK